MKFLFKRREPQEYMLWTGMVGMTLTFLVLTLMYVLRKGMPGWVAFPLPKIFGISTLFILMSSYTLYVANKAFFREDFFTYRYFLGATLLFAVFFLLAQFYGWHRLGEAGLPLEKGSISGGFLYIISGLHVLHLFGGMVGILFLLLQALRKMEYVDAFVYAVNPPNQLKLKLISTYWHFVGVLWIYLFSFFWLNH